MPQVFISYRRSDTRMAAGRLREALVRHFGEHQIFRDRESVKPGEDWTEVVRGALRGETIVLALIGADWVRKRDDAGQRLIDSGDKGNRVELEIALAQGLRIFPVLVDPAVMPTSQELPPSLRRLTNISALELRDGDWGKDVQHVIATLEREGVAPLQGTPPWGKRAVRILLTAVASLILATIVIVATELTLGWKFDTPQTWLLVLIIFGITILAAQRRARRREKNINART